MHVRQRAYGTRSARPARTPAEMELQHQSRKRRADAMKAADLDSPGWKKNPNAIRIAPEVRVDSVMHLIPKTVHRPDPHSRAFAPYELRKPSRDLRKLRASPVWKTGTMEEKLEHMKKWFPDIPDVFDERAASQEPKKPKKVKTGSAKDPIDLTCDAPRVPFHRGNCPSSDIGVFAKLPGELRNRIYRMAVLEDKKKKPAKFSMEPGTCSTGMCLHSKVSYNVPGIANTCRQMRWEVMPIFCVENAAFEFDDMMVHQSCVGNFMRSLGDYADLVREYRFLLKRPIWDDNKFEEWATYQFELTAPFATEDGGFIIDYCERKNRMICACTLDKYIDDMNERWEDKTKKRPTIGKMMLEFAESEEFMDFVWRMRKSKQWTRALEKCKKCKRVVFNN